MEAAQQSFVDHALSTMPGMAGLDHNQAIDVPREKSFAFMLATKRFFDLGAILLSAPVWLPLMGLFALMVKLDSRGPVFFKQKRTGLNGAPFMVLKFRTMYDDVCERQDLKQSKAKDDRHTRVGRLLRRTSMDELPQILNVIRGDMSLIGPRPHPWHYDQLFLHCAKGYAARFRVRPGLTGLAQVSGQRGILETQDQVQERTDSDNRYIDQWHFFTDIGIMFKTIWVVMKATNAH